MKAFDAQEFFTLDFVVWSENNFAGNLHSSLYLNPWLYTHAAKSNGCRETGCKWRHGRKLTIVQVEKETAHVLVIHLPSPVCFVLGYDLINRQTEFM